MKCNWAENRDEWSIWCATLQHFNTNRQITYTYISALGLQTTHMPANYKSRLFFAHRLHHCSMELELISTNFIAFIQKRNGFPECRKDLKSEYTTGSIVLSKRQMWNDFYNDHTMNKQHVMDLVFVFTSHVVLLWYFG